MNLKSLFVILSMFYCAKTISGFTHTNDSINGDSLIDFSKQFLGTKYKFSSIDPKKGFDCSGFVYFVFSSLQSKSPKIFH